LASGSKYAAIVVEVFGESRGGGNMPVNPSTPEPLKTALERMEQIVQSNKASLAFGAPEMHDTFWARLQTDLAEVMTNLYDESYL
jgi:hypothetical protein